MLETLELYAGLLGLVGLGGLVGMKWPVAQDRAGALVRRISLLGIAGIAGIWLGGFGAFGAAGALSLWNHQDPKLAIWGRLGWLWLAGVPYLIRWLTA